MTLLSVWTDGLASNLLAEAVGVLVSIIATYLVVHRLIRAANRRHNKPLRERLRREVGQNVAAMAHLWAFEFGEVQANDLEASYERDFSERISTYSGLIDDNLSDLETSAIARQAFLEQRGSTETFEIARETVENVRAISGIADRVDQVVLDDLELQERLTDLEGDARKLDHIHSFAEYLTRVKKDKGAPLELLLLQTIKTYQDAIDLWRFLHEPKEGEGRGSTRAVS